MLSAFTLILLVAVLAVKYATALHSVGLQKGLSEASNVAQRNQERLRKIQSDRSAVEAEETRTQDQKRVFAEHLDLLRRALAEQEAHNKEIGESLEGDK